MKKSIITLAIFSVFLLLGAVAMHAPLLKAEEGSSNNSGSDSVTVDASVSIAASSENSDSNDSDKEDVEVESEIETEDSEDKTRERSRIEVQENEVEIEIERNGEKFKLHAKGLTAEQIREIIQDRNRLRLHDNDSELPDGCERSGVTLKCEINGTRTMTVTAGQSGNIIVQVKGVNASTNVTLYKSENGTVYGIFGNETRPVELPDTVKERIRERIKARIAENESIELDEEGHYSVELRKESRFLGLLPVKEKVEMRIDASTGDVLEQHAPWWSFLARDVADNSSA